MSRITHADAWTIRVPLRTTMRTAAKRVDAVDHVVVRVVAGGVEGWGEAALNPTFTDERATTAAPLMRAALDDRVVGRTPDEVLADWQALRRANPGRVALLSAVSIAVWDLRARLVGMPLHALLGPTHRTAVDVALQLGSLEVARDADLARHGVARGYRWLKLKVGRADVGADLDAVAAVRAAAGPATLYVDANQAWSYEDAATFVRAAPEHGVRLVEQPLAADDLTGLAALGRLGDELGVIVAADEAVHDLDGLLATTVGGQRPSGMVVKVLKSADVAGARDALRIAPSLGTAVLLAGMPGDTAIVSAALLHLALTAPALELGTAITPDLGGADVVARPLEARDGRLGIEVLDGPGLGIDVDPGLVAALAVA